MGQCYRPVIGNEKGTRKSVFDEYAKLTEYTFWDDNSCECVAKKIYKTPKRVAWLGEYASEKHMAFRKSHQIPEDVRFFDPQKTFGRKNKEKFAYGDKLPLNGKFFVNHEQKKFLDLDNYRWLCEDSKEHETDYAPNPIPLLTAIGNDKGNFGDYKRTGMENVGIWAWNLVSIEDERPDDSYEEIVLCFFGD